MRSLGRALAAILFLGNTAAAFSGIKFGDPILLPEMRRPVSAAITDNRVYVLDRHAHSLFIYSQDREHPRIIGKLGREPARFASPRELALAPDGNLYIADTNNGRIQVLDGDGRHLYSFGGLKRPVSLALDQVGRVFIADEAANRIEVFTRGGLPLFGFGDHGAPTTRLNAPKRVRIGPRGTIFVLDRGGKRIARFDAQGNFEGETKAAGVDFFIRRDGSLLLLNETNARITVLGPTGRREGWFGGYGSGSNKFKRPEAFSRDPFGEVVVIDTGAKRLVAVALSPHAERSAKSRKQMDRLTLSESDPTAIHLKSTGTITAQGPGIKYVVDPKAHLVKAYNTEGIFLFDVGAGDPVAVLFTGKELLILDREKRRVFRYGPSGNPLGSWTKEEIPSGEFDDPIAMAGDGRGFVYILDHGRRRVSVFTPGGKWITDMLSGGEGRWSLKNPQSLTLTGDIVTITDAQHSEELRYRLHWKLKPPTEVVVSGDVAAVEISWNAPKDHEWTSGFLVERGKTIDGPFSVLTRTQYANFTDLDSLECPFCFYRVTSLSLTGDPGNPSEGTRAIEGAIGNRPAVAIGKISLDALFPANHNAHTVTPVGTVLLTNNSTKTIRGLSVAFLAKSFMSSETVTRIEELQPGETSETPLYADLLPKILEHGGRDYIQARISVRYKHGDVVREYARSEGFNLLGKNDRPAHAPQRAASFVTPDDAQVQALLRAVHEASPLAKRKIIDPNLAVALRLWHALSAAGLRATPHLPNKERGLRTLAFPRDLLRQGSADGSGVSILLAALLEAEGIETALVEYPDHINLLFAAESTDLLETGVPKDRLVRYAGRIWFPLDGSHVGKSFEAASRKARFDFYHRRRKTKVKIAVTREAWRAYPPAGFPHNDYSPKPLNRRFAERVRKSERTYGTLHFRVIYSGLRAMIKKKPKDLTLLGRLERLYRRHRKIRHARKIASNIRILSRRRARLLLSQAFMAKLQGKKSKAISYARRAVALDPRLTSAAAPLLKPW